MEEERDHSLKEPLLFSESEKGTRSSPEDAPGYWNTVSFGWLSPLLELGSKKPIAVEDLYPVAKKNLAGRQQKAFAEAMEKAIEKAAQEGKEVSLFKTLMKLHGHTLVKAYALKFCQILVNYLRPIILQQLLLFLSIRQMPGWMSILMPNATWEKAFLPATGYLLAILLAITAVLQSLFQQHFLYHSQQASLRIVSSIMSAIFIKSLKLSSKARNQFEAGQIINMIGADTGRLYNFIGFALDSFWSAPMQIIIAVFLLIRILGGWPLLAGLAVLFISVPLTMINGKIISVVQKAKMKAKDDRISKLKEAIAGIKLVKCMAWEEYFQKRIAAARAVEILKLFYGLLCYVVIMTTFLSVPLLIILAIFASYVLMGNSLTAVIAFPAISILNQLRVPLVQLPDAISRIAEMNVSLGRIRRLLVAEELPEEVWRRGQNSYKPRPPGHTNAIDIESGSFSYGEDTPILHDVSLSVPKGEFVAIGGPVGCGKTSLLHALLGEMKVLGGKHSVDGSIAYVSQTAFIMNGTVRDNILFGSPFNQEFYDKVLYACSLESDMDILSHGDMTEIGESGVNLSGGQKQRVSLARAVYRRSEIYLFDDPLSAVDAHVAEHIYTECLIKLLKGKTRLLITHGLQFMQKCDEVFIMKDGTIRESGKYSDLTRNGSESSLAEMARKYEQEVINTAAVDEDVTYEDLDTSAAELNQSLMSNGSLSRQASKENTPAGTPRHSIDGQNGAGEFGQLITEEGRRTGNVARAIYITYLGAAGGIPMIVAIFATAVFASLVPIASQWWISDWTEDRYHWSQMKYLDVFLLLTMLSVLAYLLRGSLICLAACNAAKKMHAGVVKSLMRAPLSFYHTTPQGRIMNRCSSDMETSDEQAGPMMANFLNQITTIVMSLVSILVMSYWFGLVIPPVAWLYYVAAQYYVASSRELKRLSSIYKSPVFKHISETLVGAVTIRAYGDVDRFVNDHLDFLDAYAKAWWPSIIINRWLSLRLDFIGGMMTAGAAFAVLAMYDLPFGLQMDAGKAGFAISQTLSITAFLGFTVMIYGQLEMTAISIERIMEYSNLKEEPPAIIEDSRPGEEWPEKGKIEFKRYSMAYRVGLPNVLHKITATIRPEERIGICGRTGAGKSSLLAALLRMNDSHKGSIVIDGIDIDSIGVQDLRRGISIIPQESTMFLGTVRFNVDPAGLYSDSDIWEAIRLVGLHSTVKEMEGKLDYNVSEEGSNLSQGQRQLLCVARAILRRSRIVLLDEATASVDVENDQNLQKVLRTVFVNCTMLTIAHRINTISDSSRILVLDSGKVAEFDSPHVLMTRPDSIYKSLVEQTAKTAS